MLVGSKCTGIRKILKQAFNVPLCLSKPGQQHPIRYNMRTVVTNDSMGTNVYQNCTVCLPGNSSLSASTLVTVHILDVNDNSPVLVGDYSWKYLCTPRWEDQALVLASRDSDGPQHGGRLNFSLRSDANVRGNWKLTTINGLPHHPSSVFSLRHFLFYLDPQKNQHRLRPTSQPIRYFSNQSRSGNSVYYHDNTIGVVTVVVTG